MKQYSILFFLVLLTALGCKLTRPTINHYPEYGHLPKSPELLEYDTKFILSMEKKYGDRKTASEKYSDFGWYYFQNGIIDTAMFRFNQSWLLDTNNASTYWGFAVLTGRSGDYKESVRYFKKSWSIDSTKKNLPMDWSISLLNLYDETKDISLINEAIDALNKALNLDTSNANAYFKLAVCNFYTNNYVESWTYIHKAKNIDEKVIVRDFVDKLLAKQPDPKEIYKK